MNRNKEFAKNTLFLLIGKFATQFMSLFLLPLYTHYLITDEFGIVDLLQTYISLFVPILTLKVDSAIFRFLIDKRDDEEGIKDIISNVCFIISIGVIVTLIACFIISNYIEIKYFKYVTINLLILMISNVILQLLRGLGKNLSYSIASTITGAVTLISNIILIVFMKKGAESILISSSIANIICILFVIFSTKFFKFINKSKINKNTIKGIINYSLPMIPNSLSWWIVNVSDRTIVSFFLGTAFNGIYTVSCKFSNLLNSVFSIFNMSWTETASLHINDSDCNDYFSSIIKKMYTMFSCIGLLILVFLPLFYDFLIGLEYLESYNYIPILIYAGSWDVLSWLLGGIYIAKKETKIVAKTTICAAVINLVTHLLLIKFIGLYAACISTLLSYFILSIYRYFDIKKYVDIRLNSDIFLIITALYILVSIFYYINNVLFLIILSVIIIAISFLLNKTMILQIIKIIKLKFRRIK